MIDAARSLVAMPTATASASLVFGSATVHRNLPAARLVEIALANGEGVLASNGALTVDTGERTGRSPGDKFLEDTPGIHDSIGWGKVNQPISPSNFARLEKKARAYLAGKSDLYRFDGFAGADPNYRLNVSVVTEEAWHCLFARNMFVREESGPALEAFEPGFVVINAARFLADPSAVRALDGAGL